MSRKVSVVMPSYNEKDEIPETIARITKNLGKDLLEIIVVDDNSPDKTWQVVKNLKNKKCRVIRRMKERGLSSAIWRGIEEAKGDIIVWRDCDLGLPPEDTSRLVEKIGKYDVVIGSRYVKGGKDERSYLRGLASVILNKFAQVILGFKIKDYTSGFIAVKSEVAKKNKFSTDGFGEYFIEFSYTVKKRGYKIKEVGYKYGLRKHGVSKTDGDFLTLVKYGIQYAYKILKIRFTVE